MRMHALSPVPAAEREPGTAADTYRYTSEQEKMFSILAITMLDDVNTINTWAEPHNANGVTPNTIIDSNDEPPANNQQRMTIRAY